MRFHLLARRVISPPALGLALVAAVAACSSSSTSSVSPPPSTHPPSSAPASPSATALITANWEAFFNGKTSATKRITLLQDGQTYTAVIQAQSSSGLASSASAKVTKVTITSPSSGEGHVQRSPGDHARADQSVRRGRLPGRDVEGG